MGAWVVQRALWWRGARLVPTADVTCAANPSRRVEECEASTEAAVSRGAAVAAVAVWCNCGLAGAVAIAGEYGEQQQQ